MNSIRPAFALLFALAAVAAGCGKSDPNAADKQRLQGVWVVEKLDAGKSPSWTARHLEEAQQLRFRFDGEKFTITDPDSVREYTFTIEATRDPKFLLISSPETPTRHARTQQWIYKFDGDYLVIAQRDDGIDAPPPDFHPRQAPSASEPSVMVVWLRKTDERAKKPDDAKGTPARDKAKD